MNRIKLRPAHALIDFSDNEPQVDLCNPTKPDVTQSAREPKTNWVDILFSMAGNRPIPDLIPIRVAQRRLSSAQYIISQLDLFANSVQSNQSETTLSINFDSDLYEDGFGKMPYD